MNALFQSSFIFSFHANLFFSPQLIDKLSTDTEVDVILADYNTVSIYVHVHNVSLCTHNDIKFQV